jgi:hypothetical protein
MNPNLSEDSFGRRADQSAGGPQRLQPSYTAPTIYPGDEEHVIFFTAGNPEVHRLLRARGRTDADIYEDVSTSFRIDCILGDLVLQSSSNYYESDITHRLGQDYQIFFCRGIAQFVVRMDYRDFITDREAARSAYPNTAEYHGYFGQEGDRRLHELCDFGFVYFRSGTMGGTIDALWQSGLNGGLQDEIVTRIQNEPALTVPDREKLLYTLTSLPKERGGAPFIWDIIETAFHRGGLALPRALSRDVRQYLLRTYFRAASTLYQPATVVLDPSRYLGGVLTERTVSRYNIQLFLAFCDSLGIRSIIQHLTAAQILELRDSLEFAPFRRAYFRLIDEAKTLEDAKIALLAKLLDERFDLSRFRTQSFEELGQAVRLGSRSLTTVQPQTVDYDRFTHIIADPERGAFWHLRNSVLARYSDGIEQVARTHRDGLPFEGSSGIIVTNNMEMHMDNKTFNTTYEVGQAAVVGPHGQAHDIVMNQTWQQVKEGIDLEKLASELAVLRSSLQPLASSADEAIELGAMAEAEKEARAGNGPGALAALKKLGKWSLGTAEKIGVGMVLFALKHACGL